MYIFRVSDLQRGGGVEVVGETLFGFFILFQLENRMEYTVGWKRGTRNTEKESTEEITPVRKSL